MDLINELPFPARLLLMPLVGEEHVRAFVVVKQTFDIGPGGELSRSQEQAPIQGGQMVTPFGTFGGEVFARKDGVDVCVLGTVNLERPAPVAVVSLHLGGYHHRLRVVGERRWIRAAGSLIPSDPVPFTQMPLTYARAFGGTVRWEGQMSMWPDNPQGVGMYLNADHAEGNALPNIEDIDAPAITSWRDRPPVAGWGPYPFGWGLRLADCMVRDETGTRVKKLLPRMFNTAHPRLVVRTIAEGETIVVEGLKPQPIRVKVPLCRTRIEVQASVDSSTAPCELDGVFLWADAAKLVLTQRARFRYRFRAGERRQVTLRMNAA